ncbi:MAG: hypothetical protein NVV72_11250 [Asticcacaulis sp.]|nr:hypothetical protein [Asticcacaulis sp.]
MVKSVAGGLLVQGRATTRRSRRVRPQGRDQTRADGAEMADLNLAGKVAKHVKSNAIVYLKSAPPSALAPAR